MACALDPLSSLYDNPTAIVFSSSERDTLKPDSSPACLPSMSCRICSQRKLGVTPYILHIAWQVVARLDLFLQKVTEVAVSNDWQVQNQNLVF